LEAAPCERRISLTDQQPQGYETRYCAFVDILGFSRLVEGLRDGSTSFMALRDLLTRLQKPMRYWNREDDAEPDFRAQSISDAVAMSTKPNIAGLDRLFFALEILSIDLLAQGFFVRGAVVKDRLYHDENVVFGEALVKAFRLEREVVRYPRLMVTREVVADVLEYKNHHYHGNYFDFCLKQSEDGPMFYHLLQAVEADVVRLHIDEFRRPRDVSSNPMSLYVLLQKQIQKRFDESIDNPRHFEKVQWFAKYWNESTYGVPNLRPIKGPGLPEGLE
jgi:hypothetical protein